MAGLTGLFRRGTTYYMRVVLPVDHPLRAERPTGRVVVSLGVSGYERLWRERSPNALRSSQAAALNPSGPPPFATRRDNPASLLCAFATCISHGWQPKLFLKTPLAPAFARWGCSSNPLGTFLTTRSHVAWGMNSGRGFRGSRRPPRLLVTVLFG